MSCKGSCPTSQDERETRLKEEKMRIGLEKMKIAHKKKVAVKVFNPDRSNKTGGCPGRGQLLCSN